MAAAVRGRLLRTLARGSLVGGAAFVGIAFAQAGALAITYKAPPDAIGPSHGIVEFFAHPLDAVERTPLVRGVSHKLQAAKGAAKWAAAAAKDGAKALDGELHAELNALQRRVQAAKRFPRMSSGGAAEPLLQEVRETGPHKRPTLNILFVGDSIVAGVGCINGNGPEIARRCAEVLAERLEMSVSWRAVGLTGADVGSITSRVIPSLRQQVSSGDVPPPDAVVLLCGVNDWKFAPLGATASGFREKLRLLVGDLRAMCGPDCVIVLPALPMHIASRFPQPLAFFVNSVATSWDEQKRRLAEAASIDPSNDLLSSAATSAPSSNPSSAAAAFAAADRCRSGSGSGALGVGGASGDGEGGGGGACDGGGPLPVFVEMPSRPRAMAAAEIRHLLSSDGVHPSDEGYRLWAEHIADRVSPHLMACTHLLLAGSTSSGAALVHSR